MSKFIATHLSMDFVQVHTYHQTQSQMNSEDSWDYCELRERVRDAIDQTVGDPLYEALSSEWWFDKTLISREDAIERCLSCYILGSLQSAAGEA